MSFSRMMSDARSKQTTAPVQTKTSEAPQQPSDAELEQEFARRMKLNREGHHHDIVRRC